MMSFQCSQIEVVVVPLKILSISFKTKTMEKGKKIFRLQDIIEIEAYSTTFEHIIL